MKLLIDIGNTNTALAVLRNKRILKRYFVHSSKKNISTGSLKRLLCRYIVSIDTIMIVSVVPDFLRTMRSGLKKIFPDARILVAGEDIEIPIRNKYKKPGEVGKDRLVTAFAAKTVEKTPVIVVDFGTAVTIDYVNGKGEYCGGFIFPGLRLALESLEKDTALLPHIAVKPSGGLIGKNTRSSMNNGLLFGYAAMCDGLIDRLKKKYGRSLRVIATGGDAGMVSRYSRCIKRVYPDLVFKGLMDLG